MSSSNVASASATQPVSSTPDTSTTPPTTSSQQQTTSQAPVQSTSNPPSTTDTTTSTETASATPTTTHYVTHVTTISTSDGTNTTPQVIVVTRTSPIQNTGADAAASATSSSPAALQGGNGTSSHGSSSGLSTAGITAIAVVIPVAVVALLVGLGIWFWRKRKNRKDADEQRRKEMEDYSYNPNGDPTLPAVGSEAGGTTMTEDHSSGYRGWGAAAVGMSNRKASTTLSGGHTQQLSDAGSHGYGGPNSPSGHYSDGHSSDPIVNNRDTMGSDDLGALGVAPAANQGGIRRGPSNASSAYSAGGRSEHSEDAPPLPGPIDQSYGYQQNYGYGQHGPYGDGTYGGGQDSGMPIVQDVSARRNTRIQPGGAYQQGNSGIAQNF